MKKIISVVGPTASGKTSFALDFAKKELEKNFYTGIDLISVDSRQVYRGLEVLSGADVPKDFEVVELDGKFRFFKHKDLEITIKGVSILSLNDEWSVAHFKDFATEIILNSFKNNRLPILVGGTGLYHQYLFSTDKNLYVPPNQELRDKAENMSLPEIQNWLKELDLEKFNSMNNSDINNPRRLIRAIEISLGKPKLTGSKKLPTNLEVKTMVIGLDMDLEEIQNRIFIRVQERYEQGAINEVKDLLRVCTKKDMPVCSTLGVSDINKFISGKFSKEECIKNWALHEFQYAKRQLTWFKNKAIS